MQQTAVATSAGAAGVLLLLVLGTQILNWQWPLALFVVALGIGVYRVRQRQIPMYSAAQSIDRSLGLQDRLATAYYFRRVAQNSPELVNVVERQALDRIHQGDVERAIPLRFPSAGYASCALVAAAIGLFAVRYGMLKTLNLERPIARISFDTFGTPPKVQASTSRKSVVQEHLEKQLEQLGLSLEEMEKIQERSAEKPNATNVQAVADEPGGTQKAPPGSQPAPGDDGTDENKGEEQASSGSQSGESKDEGSGQASAAQKGQPSPTPPKAAPKQGGSNPGVMDKMKDALANLLNKLGANPQQQGEEKASNDQSQGGSKQQMSQKGTQGQGKSQGDSQPAPDPEGGKESEGGEQAPGQQQRASQEGSKSGSESAKSGMGKSDGDKSIQDAEHKAAMGKISEIFGKRAAEMQGEMSVEVPSGKQQLKTAYSNSSASHAGAVADSNRNEIPLVYQPYVRRYFEEVRKAAAASKPKPATP